MTKEEKDLIISWFNHIEQMATDRKTLNGAVMEPMETLDEIKVLAKDSVEVIEKFWDNKGAWEACHEEE